MNSKLTENITNQKDSLEQSSIEKKVLEGSIEGFKKAFESIK